MQRSRGSRRAALTCAVVLAACAGDGATGPNFSGPPTPVSLKFCATVRPTWVGYQNGNAAWVTISQDAATPYTYSFNINGGGALAYVLPVSGNAALNGYSTEIVYATAAELQQFVVASCTASPRGTKTIRGALAGIGSNELGQITLGASSSGVVSANGSDASYTLRSVADVSQDLIAVRRTTVDLYGDVARAIVRRGINPADGTTMSSLDFNGTEAVTPVNALLTLSGSNVGGLMTVTSILGTVGGSAAVFTALQGSGTSIPFMGLSAGTIPGDLHVLAVTMQESQSTSRSVESYFRNAGNRSMTVGPLIGTPTVTALTGIPYVRFRMDIPSQSEYSTAAIAEISTGGFGALSRSVELVVTAGYLGGAPATWALSMPDLTEAGGYEPQYGMPTGLALTYLGVLTGGNRLFFAKPADGQTLSYGLRQGTAVTNGDVTLSTAVAPPSSERADLRSFVPAGRPWRKP